MDILEESMFFSEMLRMFRMRRKLTQKQLAAQIGVSRATISLWERGYYVPEALGLIHELIKVLVLTDEEKRLLVEARYGTGSVLSLPNLPTQGSLRSDNQKRRTFRKTSAMQDPPPHQRSDNNVPASVEKGRGRPRKGGVGADVRRGFEVTFDVRTIALLDTATDNRSEYLENLVLEHLCPISTDEDQLELELQRECKRFPLEVSNKLREIRAKFGIRAALEASEAIFFLIS